MRIKRTVVTLFLVLSLALASGAMAGRTAGGDSFPGGSDLPGDGGGSQVTEVDNKNLNTNINTNKAYGGNASQGQIQGQAQGQGQAIIINGGTEGGVSPFSTSIDSGALSLTGATNNNTSGAASNSSATGGAGGQGGSASANNSIVIEGSQRDFHTPLAAPNYGAGDVRWGPKEKDQVRGFISLETVVALVGEVRNKGFVPHKKRQMRAESFVAGLERQPDTIRLTLKKPEGTKLHAIGSVFTDKGEGLTTARLVKEAAYYCGSQGAENLVLISQTVTNEMYSSGWGIGLGYNAAGMSNGGDMSQIGSGGTGYSSAKGGHSYRLGLEFACVD